MGRKKIESIKARVQVIDAKVGASVAVDRIRGREHGRIRQRILVRDGAQCRKCGCGLDLEVDHEIPLHLGGQESDLNRQLLCEDCHRAKTEQEGRNRGS